MTLRSWLGRATSVLSESLGIRHGPAVVLWRLRRRPDVGEAVCLIEEPSLGVFHVVVAYNGRPEVRRVIHGIDQLVDWATGLEERLEADGWREVDANAAGRLGARPVRLETSSVERWWSASQQKHWSVGSGGGGR